MYPVNASSYQIFYIFILFHRILSFIRTQKVFFSFLSYIELALEPSVSQGTHIYSCRLPALDRFLPTQLGLSKPSQENSRGSPEFPNQNLRQIGQGVSELCSDKQTNTQTSKIIFVDKTGLHEN